VHPPGDSERLADQFEKILTQRGFTVDVLQGAQDRNEFVATLQIEFDFANGRRAQAGLRIERETHTVSFVKNGGAPVKNGRIPPNRDPWARHLHEKFPKKAQQNGFLTISDRL